MSMRSPSIVLKGALFFALPCLVFSGCKEKQLGTCNSLRRSGYAE
jgi:hypothetical protein